MVRVPRPTLLDLERVARRAPLVGRLLPAPPAARPPRRRVPPPPSSSPGTAPDLLGALDAAHERLRDAIPPRPDDE